MLRRRYLHPVLVVSILLPGCDDPDEHVTALGLGDSPPGAPHVTSCPSVDAELNDSVPTAVELPGLTSCSGSARGVLAGGNDVDYFRFTSNASLNCTVIPSVQTDGDVRVCIFPECAVGATELGGCRSGTYRYLKSGLVGCCADATGRAEPMTFACTDPPATSTSHVYLRVDVSVADQACHRYTLNYTF
jgi:hypothetical protein